MLNYECKVETKSPIRRELTISVKPESIKGYVDEQLEEVRKTAKIRGFRQGKVPLTIIRQYYMEDVKSKVFSTVIRESYLKALEDNQISVVGMPQIEPKSGSELNEGEPLTFTAMVEVFPDIKVSDLSKIKVTRESAEVKDEDVDKSMQNLRESNAEIVPDESATGPAKTDDYLMVTFKGTVDGKEIDSLKGENRLVQLGAKQYMEDFENALIGAKKGDVKEFDISFPADFGDAKLAGKKAHFTVTVHEFKKKQLPEIDDEFAKRFKLESRLELRKKVFETMKEDREREVREKLKEGVLQSLIEKHTFEVPSALVGSQLEHLVKENSQYLTQNGFTEKMVRDYLEKNKEQLQKRAEEQVRASLILDRIAEEQKVRVEPADLDHEYTKIADRLKMPLDQVKKLYEQDENAVRQLRYRIKEDRTIEYILSQVKITEA